MTKKYRDSDNLVKDFMHALTSEYIISQMESTYGINDSMEVNMHNFV